MDEEIIKFKLFEPSSPESLLAESSFFPFFIGFFVVGVVLVWGIFKQVQKHKKAASAISQEQAAYAVACNELQAIDVYLPARDVATLASLALRKYLMHATKDPTLFETHEEALLRDGLLSGLPRELQTPTIDTLTELANLKYCLSEIDTDISSILATASARLDTLHQAHRA